MMELNLGKNLTNITHKENTENIVTRLYVEGEYTDYGHVGIPQGVQEAVGRGICMDRLYRRYGRTRDQLRHIVLAVAAGACEVEGFQEFLFDLLANFPVVDRLTVELSGLTGADAEMHLTVLR